jgi:hypothetical protein
MSGFTIFFLEIKNPTFINGESNFHSGLEQAHKKLHSIIWEFKVQTEALPKTPLERGQCSHA